MSKKVAVIIPFYKDDLSQYESIALEQCFKVLGGHTIIAIKPERLILPDSVTKYPFLSIVSFNDSFFADVQGYNRLMLSAEFYSAFIDYEFVLIHQLDAFVFKDDLLDWCNRGFDYIGAPWIQPHPFPDLIKTVKSKIQYYLHTRFNVLEDGIPSTKQFEYKVGNGGFSLRRTKIFHEICLKQADKIQEYTGHQHHRYNEDAFWSIEVNRKRKILSIPNYKTGVRFAFEFYPNHALKINHSQLPFGCHAWDLQLDFWRPVFKEQGYEI